MGVEKIDGRDARWAEHRTQRRQELVADALRAVRKNGAGVGMEEIAIQAGTSKTVLYRHFKDRAGLYTAVVEHVHGFIHRDLESTLSTAGEHDLGQVVHDLAKTYLTLVERDPQIYRFVLTPPTPDTDLDPYGGLPELIGDHLSRSIAQVLGLADPVRSQILGHGIVGFIRAAADRWMLSETPIPIDELLAQLDEFFTPALEALTPLEVTP